MNPRKTLILAVVLALALLYIFKVDMPQDEAKRMGGLALAGAKPEAINTVKIEVQGEAPITLQRPAATPTPVVTDDESPQFTTTSEPWKVADLAWNETEKAATERIAETLAGLQLGEALSEVKFEQNAQEFALDKPFLKITAGTGQNERTLLFGKLNEYLKSRYLAVAGQQDIYLVSEDDFKALRKTPAELRSKQPVAFTDGEVIQLKVAASEAPDKGSGKNAQKFLTKFELDRSNTGKQWRISSHDGLMGYDAVIMGLVRSVRGLRAAKIIDNPGEELARYGLDKPVLSVEVAFKQELNKSPLSVKFGRVMETAQDGKTKVAVYYFQRSGLETVFQLIGPDPFALFLRTELDLREKKRFQFDVEKVTSFKIQGEDKKPLELTKSSAEWQVNGQKGDETFIKNVLKNLNDLTAIDFPPNRGKGSALGAVRYTAELTVSGKEGEQPVQKRLEIGAPFKSAGEGSGYVAQANGDPELFVITEESLRKISPRLETLVVTEESPAASVKSPG